MNTAETARDFYEYALSPDNVAAKANWGVFLKNFIRPEVQRTIGARVRKRMPVGRKIVSSVMAAELFPDRNPPEMLIAESELETHDDLRNKYGRTHPETEPRISGDIFTEQSGKNFFRMDGIMLSIGATTFFGMRSDLNDVIEILLSKGLVPTDAEYKIVPRVNK